MRLGRSCAACIAIAAVVVHSDTAGLATCDGGSCGVFDSTHVEDSKASLALLQRGQADRRSDSSSDTSESAALVYAGEATAKILAARADMSGNSSQIPVPGFMCPKVNPLTKADGFSIDEYVRASWYVQEQQTLAYQRESQLDCVVATYDNLGSVAGDFSTIPFYWGDAVAVYNYCSPESGCRPTLDDNGDPSSILCAAYPSARKAALKVLPCFLPEFLGGNYWVIAVGTDSKGEYEWAVVSGGQPKVRYPDGCTTYSGSFAYYDAGLWLFSRTENLDAAKKNDAMKAMTKMGFTLSQLKTVRQGAGCSYKGAYIKK